MRLRIEQTTRKEPCQILHTIGVYFVCCLFNIFQLAKESLTEGNIPRQPCVICQQHFEEGESFTRTECYHYFHCHCLGRYVQHCLNEVTEVSRDSQAAVASQPLQNGCDEPNKDVRWNSLFLNVFIFTIYFMSPRCSLFLGCCKEKVKKKADFIWKNQIFIINFRIYSDWHGFLGQAEKSSVFLVGIITK